MSALIRWSLLIVCLVSGSAMASGAIVVSPGAGLDSVADSAAARLFLGRSSEIDGVALKPINQDEGQPIRERFEQEVLGMTGARLRSHWSRLIFTGAGEPPEDVGGDDDVKAFVRDNPGAIGYINSASVDDSVTVVLEF